MAINMFLLAISLGTFIVQYNATPINFPISEFKADIYPQLSFFSDLLMKQAETLSAQIKDNADNLPPVFTEFDVDAIKEEINERKKQFTSFLDLFKPNFEKRVKTAIDFLKSAKSSNEEFEEAKSQAIEGVQDISDTILGAVDGMRVALSENVETDEKVETKEDEDNSEEEEEDE